MVVFSPTISPANPPLSYIILLDALLSHMQAVAWAEKEGIKPQRSSSSNVSTAVTSPTTGNSPIAAGGSNADESYASTPFDNNEQKSEAEANNALALQERQQSTKDLLQMLVNTFNVLRDTVCIKMVQILPLANITPDNILECILAIVNSNNSYCTDLCSQFLKLLDNKNKEVITGDWCETLSVSDAIFSKSANPQTTTQQYPAEMYTLTVIEAHIAELTSDNYYSTLNSFKHCLKSLFNLLNLLLTTSQQHWQHDSACKSLIEEQLKPMLIETLMDARMEYVFDIAEKCLQTLMQGVDQAAEQQQLMSYNYILKYHYRFLMEYADELRNSPSSTQQSVIFNESLLFAVVKSMSQMLEKPMGIRAVHQFFTQKPNDLINKPSIVDLLLSFTGTNLSMSYARKLLQFVERLFQISQQSDSGFPQEDLINCFGDLANIEQQRIKCWLTHVIYGPQSVHSQQAETPVEKQSSATGVPATTSSTSSSNAQTPTNMATISAIASLSEQFGNQSSTLDNAEAMDIEEDNASNQPAAASGTAQTAAGGQQNSSAAAQSLSLWPQQSTTAGNSSFLATNQSEPLSTTQDEQLQNQQQSERNGSLLLNVIKYIVHDDKGAASNAVAMLLFQSLLQLGQTLITPSHETNDFSDILQIMICLADCAQGKGHSTLFNATIMWLEITKFQILEKTQNLQNSSIMPASILENVNALLRYLHELLQSLGHRGSKHQQQPAWDDDIQTDLEDLMDDLANEQQGGDEDSFVEDSDEDSLNNKLCTFSLTQKEFMNQHWYHCHTCNMVNTVGVCSVCARVCHKGHDVSYAKYGNFFCDCGAKEDGSCQALRRRISSGVSGVDSRGQQNDYSSAVYSNNNGVGGAMSQTKRAQTPPSQSCLSQQQQNINVASQSASNNFLMSTSLTSERISLLSKLLESSKDVLQNPEQWTIIVKCILEFFDVIMPAIKENCDLFSIVGCHRRAKAALLRLHGEQTSFQHTDQLMQPTLGSQEGAFENVRMSYSGDQGQTIKQLLSSGLVRRVALCCLSSPHGKRQHLAVSHEKGKVTILQLSALLKQDAAKRKLTLTQLSSAPIPCTILSLTANPANEDCLAVCGLKECHILTFTNTAATSDHIVLTPQLENGNFIKKALWLPGSQTMLALVTADYVKIYELSEDTYSPKYYFLVAVGKIRDCCFVYQDGVYYMLIIASSGYIYYQKLDDQSLAKHGDFYVTNTLELNHTQIKDVNGQEGGGGVSIYYSHTLQLLFFSYSVGKSFVAPLTDVNKGVKCITHLQTSPSSKNSSKGPPQPLCQWTEIPGHPGLICAMMHTSNNPVIFMFTPERILMQEIKAQSSKSRIMDMVAIRHTVAGVEKTTLILLCEDGSLRIFTANQETTSFWLSPQVQPLTNQLYSSNLNSKSSCSTGSNKKSKRKSSHQQKIIGPNGSPIFPIDFFEHCTMLPDVDFGGNDLLQIYNKQKLKTRLFSTGMFVASTKATGFTLEVYNNDPNNMVIVGIRVLLGTQDPHRAPQNVTILGRTIPTPVRRARWFDIPLTREEMLQCDKCLKVVFGKSRDPENVCMLDSIEVYGKSKDLVGWPDDTDEVAAQSTSTNAGNGAPSANSYGVMGSSCSNFEGYNSITQLDKMVTMLLEVLDCSLSLLGQNQGSANFLTGTIKQKATNTATALLLLPAANQVQVQSRYVLATLFGNRQAYHYFKDYEMIVYVNDELQVIS